MLFHSIFRDPLTSNYFLHNVRKLIYHSKLERNVLIVYSFYAKVYQEFFQNLNFGFRTPNYKNRPTWVPLCSNKIIMRVDEKWSFIHFVSGYDLFIFVKCFLGMKKPPDYRRIHNLKGLMVQKPLFRGVNYPRQEVIHHIRSISICILHKGINSGSIYRRLSIYFWWERRSKYQILTKGSTFYQLIVMWSSFLFFPNCLLTFHQVEHNFRHRSFCTIAIIEEEIGSNRLFSTILLSNIIAALHKSYKRIKLYQNIGHIIWYNTRTLEKLRA